MADVTITAGNVVPSSSAAYASGDAGETIAAGELVYRKSDDLKYYKADGNDTAKLPVVGIAGNSAAAGQKINIVTEDLGGLVIGTHSQTIGEPLFLSNTAGKIMPYADVASGNYTSVVGLVKTATAIIFRPLPGGVAHG